MAAIRCIGCGRGRLITVQSPLTSIRGQVTCHDTRKDGSPCEATTVFHLEEDMISYISGDTGYGTPNGNVPDKAKRLFAEAETSFGSGAPNAAAAMCRASIEFTLDGAGFKANNLYDRVIAAQRAKKLTDEEVMLAHGSRIITRNAIHLGDLVELSDIPSMLSAAVQIMNALYP